MTNIKSKYPMVDINNEVHIIDLKSENPLIKKRLPLIKIITLMH